MKAQAGLGSSTIFQVQVRPPEFFQVQVLRHYFFQVHRQIFFQV